MRPLACVLLITACGGCGDDGGGAVDATPVVDIDNASCGDQLNFTGELVDWDSSAASFCGVNGATFNGGGGMSNTPPNGRFAFCIPRSGVTNVTITPPGSMSGCSSMPGTYTMGAIGVANPATILAGTFWSGRIFTMQRAATLGAGITIDPAKAQVIVHVEGQQRGVAILATHGTAQAFNGTTWAAGEVGKDVYFPNVDVAGTGTTMLTVVGGAVGTGPIMIAPNKITLVNVLAQ